MKKISVILLVLVLCCACSKKEDIIPKKNLDVEIFSEVKIGDLVKAGDGVTIKNKKDSINTEELGKKKVTVKYKNKKGESKKYTLKINVVDTTKPTIEASDEITIVVGQKDDLTDNVKVEDNSKEEIKVNIEGEYNIDEVGEYELKYVAKDVSGNKAEKKFKLIVEEVKLKTTGFYVYKTSDAWYAFKFNDDNTVNYIVNPCPGDACGAYAEDGTYTVDGNKISATTKFDEMDETWEASSEETKWDITITDEENIRIKGYNYRHQNEF